VRVESGRYATALFSGKSSRELLTVQVFVKVSPGDYDRLLNRVPAGSLLHDVLKTGVIIDRGGTDVMVYILCEKVDANLLLRVAEQLRPKAVLQFEPKVRHSPWSRS
jgi:hypothetical protein